MPNPLAGLAVKLALALGAGAFFAFGIGFMVSQFRGMVSDADTRGYERGVAEMALKFEQDSRTLREQFEQAAREREAEIEARRREAETRASEADKRARDALRKLIENDASFAQCEGQMLPDDIRRHIPPSLLLETVTADSRDRRS